MNSLMLRRKHAGLSLLMALAAFVFAFWPVWRWYALRLQDSGEEAWGLVGLLGALWVICKDAGYAGYSMRIGWSPVLLTVVYALAYVWLPPLLRAVLALTALGCLLPCFGLRRAAAFQAVGFMIMSLPMMPSLQFYLGYPLRIVSGEVAARLINLAGFPVVREGTLLSWQSHTVFIDMPCSGIKMLWAGIMLGLALSTLRRYGSLGTLSMLALAVGTVLAGNIMRTAALFFLETGVVAGPPWAHGAVGVAVFISMAMGMAWGGGRLLGWQQILPQGTPLCQN